MLASELITTIKNSLDDDNVYRTDAFLLTELNKGYKLTSLLTLFDEARSNVDISGTRNFFALPKRSSDVCIAPLYVADTNTGKRIHPARVDNFEFYSSGWEGTVDADGGQYYTLLSPYNYAHAAVVVCPIENVTSAQYTMLGAFEPSDLVSTDTIRIPDAHMMTLFYYTRFAAFISEPGRSEDALGAYKSYMEEIEKFVITLKSRFPSGRDYEPHPPEFTYDNVTDQQRKVAAPKEKETKNESE